MGTDSGQTLYLSPGNLVGDTSALSQGKDLDLREAVARKKVSPCNAEGIQRERVASLRAEKRFLQVCSLLMPVLWLGERRCK